MGHYMELEKNGEDSCICIAAAGMKKGKFELKKTILSTQGNKFFTKFFQKGKPESCKSP